MKIAKCMNQKSDFIVCSVRMPFCELSPTEKNDILREEYPEEPDFFYDEMIDAMNSRADEQTVYFEERKDINYLYLLGESDFIIQLLALSNLGQISDIP